MVEYTVRHYEKGDEKEIVRVFNEVYEAYGGVVPRTVEYWRWCCLKRPDVEENGIFLVVDQKSRVVGYAVVGSTGNIWEFCASGDKEEVASLLIRETLRYLDRLDVSSVRVNVPRDAELGKVFAEAGLGEISGERMFVSSLSPRDTFAAAIANRKNESICQFEEVVAVTLSSTPQGIENAFSIRAHGGEVEVASGLSEYPSMSVRMDFVSFLSVLLGGSGPYRFFFKGQLRVKPFWKAIRFLKYLSSLRVDDRWSFPLSDFG